MEFSRPAYWSGQPFPSPEDLPNPGIKPRFSTLQEDSLPAEVQGKPWDPRVLFKTALVKICVWSKFKFNFNICIN